MLESESENNSKDINQMGSGLLNGETSPRLMQSPRESYGNKAV